MNTWRHIKARSPWVSRKRHQQECDNLTRLEVWERARADRLQAKLSTAILFCDITPAYPPTQRLRFTFDFDERFVGQRPGGLRDASTYLRQLMLRLQDDDRRKR